MFTDVMDKGVRSHGPGSVLFGANANGYPGLTIPEADPGAVPHSRPQPPPPPPIPAPTQVQTGRIPVPPDAVFDPNIPLKSVSFPRDCLPRFLAIAKVNTEMNRETCGLLLGKDKGHKYSVTTLLIPRQHSTSDTCTMDEEELVLKFTEERNLITLGWVRYISAASCDALANDTHRIQIHTHPSQSCFMSSVDLHTHSGFQRMLPESFAVVCAPKSNPKYVVSNSSRRDRS